MCVCVYIYICREREREREERDLDYAIYIIRDITPIKHVSIKLMSHEQLTLRLYSCHIKNGRKLSVSGYNNNNKIYAFKT